MNDPAEHHRFLSLAQSAPRPVFRYPRERKVQQRENTSLSRSSEVGNPIVVKDKCVETNKAGASTIASIESEIDTTYLYRSCSREQPKTHGRLNAYAIIDTTTEPTTLSLDRRTSPLPPDREKQIVHGGDHGVIATVNPLSATTATLPFPEQPQGYRGSVLDKEEWEIIIIVGKRRTRRGYKYKVRWKNILLYKNGLGNAQELLREFEAKDQAQQGGKRGRPAHIDKGL